MTRRRLTPEEKVESVKRRKEQQAEHYRDNKKDIRASQKIYSKNKKREKQYLTRKENNVQQEEACSIPANVNMRDTMFLSPEKFLKAAKQYCRENL